MLHENSLDSTIRAPIGPLMAKKLLVHMKNWQAKVSNQSKARANTHQAMLDGDDPQACADVPADVLAVPRGTQATKPGLAKRRMERLRALKQKAPR